MINALKLVSVRRGYDPRDFVLIAFGGGGAMHAGALARELRVKEVLIPNEPAVFSAWGMLMTDLRQDFIRTFIQRADQIAPSALTTIYQEMETTARRNLRDQHVSEERIMFQRFADMRYLGQEHTVKVPIPGGEIAAERMPDICERFHQLHEHAYTFRLDTLIEFVNYHVTGFGVVDKPQLKKLGGAQLSVDTARKGTRRVNFDELGYHNAAIYERSRLPVGVCIEGPVVIEEPAATTVVFPDQKVQRDEYGFLHIRVTCD
jgi:N-methylhydantoinase A